MLIRASAVVFAILLLASCRHGASQMQTRARIDPTLLGVLPAGTTIALRVVTPINTAEPNPGEAFAAVVGRELRDAAGQLVAGAGSPARLVVTGTGVDRQIALAAVMRYGSWFSVGNAAGVHGGAPLGTLERAVSEAGATYSTGPERPDPEVHVRGQRILIPSTALLMFRLNEPLKVEGIPVPN